MSDINNSEQDIKDAVRNIARMKPVLDLADAADAMGQSFDESERMVEAILFASSEPLRASVIASKLPENIDVGECLAKLKRRYIGRGVVLNEVAGGWRFQTANDLAYLLEEKKEDTRKLSKAALETLSIIAYHQPCTRAEIEEIRGVSVGRGTLDLLIEIKWIRPAGRRRTIGKPLTYRTTPDFLAHFNLSSLDDLPGKAELQSQGLLSANLPKDFEMPKPSDLGANFDDENYEETSETHQAFIQDFFDE